MKKISYTLLQKKYELQVVALDKSETHVLASGKRLDEIIEKLKTQNINPQDCVFMGPIQKYGVTNIYFSL